MELWQSQILTYFLTWWPSYSTIDLAKQSGSVLSQDIPGSEIKLWYAETVVSCHEKCHFVYNGIKEDEFDWKMWRNRWRNRDKNYIFLVNFTRSFYIHYCIEALLNISKFLKLTKFGANFFVGIVIGHWVCYVESQAHFLYFVLLIDARAEKLTMLWQFQNLTYFFSCDLVIWYLTLRKSRVLY